MSSLESPPQELADCRLYVPRAEDWRAHVKQGWDKMYCYAKNPGEDYFHLIVGGEIYLQKGDDVLCLQCAARQGIVTNNRLYWQRQPPRPT